MVMVFGVLRAWWGDGFGFRILECPVGRWWGGEMGRRGDGWGGGGERNRVTMKQTPEKAVDDGERWLGDSCLRCSSVPQCMETNQKTPFPKCMHARSLS